MYETVIICVVQGNIGITVGSWKCLKSAWKFNAKQAERGANNVLKMFTRLNYRISLSLLNDFLCWLAFNKIDSLKPGCLRSILLSRDFKKIEIDVRRLLPGSGRAPVLAIYIFAASTRRWRGVNEVTKSTPQEISQHSYLGGNSGGLFFRLSNPIRSRESTYSRFNSPAGWKNHGFLLPCNGFSPLSLASAELQFTLVAVFVSLMF